ncbi:hypothetical protein C8J57DRAFT_1472726 [Mycena rebaudengoi]|nr:hypothetical protein C8J57DRAFT_1472726 [Mycena rebaudengoi]
MSGYLRQEFRELEMLDEITKLRHEGSLPNSITGIYCGHLLQSYCNWKKNNSDPEHFHPSLRWDSLRDNKKINIDYDEWHPTFFAGKQTTKKRKMGEDSTPPSKRNKSSPTVSNPLNHGESSSTTSRLEVAVNPPGLIWDSVNFGRAYDSLFVPLSFVLRDNPVIWSTKMSDKHPIVGVWVLTLQQSAIPELARDSVRRILHHQAPNSFPLGRRGLQLDVLYMALTNRITYASAVASCGICHSFASGEICVLSQVVHVYHVRSLHDTYPEGFPLSKWFEHNFSKMSSICQHCHSKGVNNRTKLVTSIFDIPLILFVTVSADALILDPILTFHTLAGRKQLRLSGVVYFEQTTPEIGHFTSISVDSSGRTWFRDGISTRRSYIAGPLIQDISPAELRRRDNLRTAIYAEHLE